MSARQIRTPIWRGTPQWEPTGRPIWAERHDEALRMAVSPSTPLVLSGRNSNSSPSAGAREAAQEIHDAAIVLHRNHGWDVRPILPAVEELVTFLTNAGNVRKSVDPHGHAFSNRFCLIDVRSHGLVLSISAGTARKIDSAYRQPFVDWLFDLAADPGLNLCGFYFFRRDRMLREAWSQGPLLHRLRDIEATRNVWVGDDQGRWDLSRQLDVVRFMQASGAETEADVFYNKRIASQLDHSDDVMSRGHARYAISQATPPGTFRYKDAALKRWVMAIDSPEFYPKQTETLSTLPSVFLEDGRRADQAGTVQWFLSELGKPGRGLRDLWPELVARRYSTEGLRRTAGQGPEAYYGWPGKPFGEHSWDEVESWSRALINNLSFYEEGVMVRSLGPRDPSIVIANCFPATGPWASPTDFARIRAYLRDRAPWSTNRKHWSWSGMPITVNGHPGRLRAPGGIGESDEVRWSVQFDEVTTPSSRPATCPTLPDSELTKAILDALIDADGKPLSMFVTEASQHEQVRALQAQRKTSDDRRQMLDRRVERRRSDAYAEDQETGKPLLDDQERHELLRANSNDKREIDELRALVATIDQQLSNLDAGESGAALDDLQTVIDGLKNPRTSVYRSALRDAIANLSMTVTRGKVGRLRGHDVHLSGHLVIATTTGPYALSFTREFQVGALKDVEAGTGDGLAMIRAGLPQQLIPGSRDAEYVSLGWAALGVDRNATSLPSCTDTDLLRLAVAACYPDAVGNEEKASIPSVSQLANDPKLVEAFGDVAQLVCRLQTIHSVPGSRQWLGRDDNSGEAVFMLASLGRRGLHDVAGHEEEARRRNAGSLRQNLKARSLERFESWVWHGEALPDLKDCLRCGGSWLVPLRLKEPAGYVCLTCRSDRDGITWPLRFDRYITRLDLWREVGAPLSPPEPGPSPTTRRDRSRYRHSSDLTLEEREEIVRLYSAGEVKVKEIAEQFGTSTSSMYSVVRTAGVRARYSKVDRRWAS